MGGFLTDRFLPRAPLSPSGSATKRGGFLLALAFCCLISGLPLAHGQEPAPVPPEFEHRSSDMSRELQQVVHTLEENGCLFGYGAALSNELMQWREHGCIRVDGSKFDQTKWHLLLELPEVKLLSLHDTPTLPAITDVLRQLSQLRELQLHNSLDDSGMSNVAELPLLKALVVSKSNITDHGIWYLEELQTLEQIELEDLKISTDSIQYLKRLPRLTELNIINADLSDSWDLRPGDFASLAELSLRGKTIDDRIAGEVAKITGLKRLTVEGNAMTMEGFSRLATMPSLHTLSVSRSLLQDDSWEWANPNDQLRELDVSYTGAGEKFLGELGCFPHLNSLNLSGASISDQSLAHLNHLRDLHILCLNETAVTSEGLAGLRTMENLREVHLSKTKVDGEGLPHLAQLKDLEWIDLSDTQVRGENLALLAGLPRLRGLALFNTPISSEDLPHLRRLTNVDEVYTDGSKLSIAEEIELRQYFAEARARRIPR